MSSDKKGGWFPSQPNRSGLSRDALNGRPGLWRPAPKPGKPANKSWRDNKCT